MFKKKNERRMRMGLLSWWPHAGPACLGSWLELVLQLALALRLSMILPEGGYEAWRRSNDEVEDSIVSGLTSRTQEEDQGTLEG